MRICTLMVRNYRTLESLDLEFPSYYSAICGRNDSGKTNVVNAIRGLMKEDEPYGPPERPEFSLNDDFTKWVEGDAKQRAITVSVGLRIDPEQDTGLHKFIVDYLGLQATTSALELAVQVVHRAEGPQEVAVTVERSHFDGLKAEEVLKRLQTSRTFFFHSSTDPNPRSWRGFGGALRDISEEYTPQLDRSKKLINSTLKRIARDRQEEIEALLGRLKERYKVGLSWPTFDLSYFPYHLTLGDQKVEIELEEWGSGTRNRTMILLAVFRAKQVADSKVSAAKVTPILVIEEPESFLHPLAQAEFGRVLQDLSEEFKVQIIVTTHSPYLLSQDRPESNILLERRITRRQVRQTERVNTSGDRWMEPFALSLGLSDDSFQPWRDLFFRGTSKLLLVEGELDRQYFELLRDARHGNQALDGAIEIFPYGGRDTLRNQALLNFIRLRFDKVFITYDLDAESVVEPALRALGMIRKKNYLAVGLDEPGKRKIEGLLPERVWTAVLTSHPAIGAALTGSNNERKDAEGRLKRLLLDRFAADGMPGKGDYDHFYGMVRVINSVLAGKGA